MVLVTIVLLILSLHPEQGLVDMMIADTIRGLREKVLALTASHITLNQLMAYHVCQLLVALTNMRR